MSLSNDYRKVSILIIGGGPGGLSAALKLKLLKPDIDICIIEKSEKLGNHNLSGASLEPQPLFGLLDEAAPGWQETEQAKQVFASKVEKSDLLFLLGKKLAFNISPAMKLAKLLRLGIGQMIHKGQSRAVRKVYCRPNRKSYGLSDLDARHRACCFRRRNYLPARARLSRCRYDSRCRLEILQLQSAGCPCFVQRASLRKKIHRRRHSR
jgi:hypothetical protein